MHKWIEKIKESQFRWIVNASRLILLTNDNFHNTDCRDNILENYDEDGVNCDKRE